MDAGSLQIPVEVLSWVNKLVGGPGTGEVVLEAEVPAGATVRSVLRRVTERFPELGRALWDPTRPREIGDSIEVMVNNAVLGVTHDLDSEVTAGDRLMLLGQYIGGRDADGRRDPADRARGATGARRPRRWDA